LSKLDQFCGVNHVDSESMKRLDFSAIILGKGASLNTRIAALLQRSEPRLLSAWFAVNIIEMRDLQPCDHAENVEIAIASSATSKI
jgi:hypothetical protein